jgi:hypothetical protein
VRATFVLGPKAARWAERIRDPKSLIHKLCFRPEHRVVLLGASDEEVARDVRPRAADTSTRLQRHAEVILFGTASDSEWAPRDAPRLHQAGRDDLIVTPKAPNGIKDTAVIAAGRSAVLVDVKVAAFAPAHAATKSVLSKPGRR